MLKRLVLVLLTIVFTGLFITDLAQVDVKKAGSDASKSKEGNSHKSDSLNSTEDNNNKLIPPEIASLINQARSLPAEFHADALIRIANHEKIKGTEYKSQLLEEAFSVAGDTQFQVKKEAIDITNIDTRLGYLDQAYSLNLDALALRCRVVTAFLENDKHRARDLFAQIPLKSYISNPLSCGDNAIYNVSIYYDTLKKVSEIAFTAKETEEGDQFHFIDGIIANISSPVELFSAANFLASLKLKEIEFSLLINAFSGRLKNISTNYYEFFQSETFYGNVDAIHNLIDSCKKQHIAANSLIDNYKDYLVSNLSQKRCGNGPASQAIPQYIAAANKLILMEHPITAEEIKISEDVEVLKSGSTSINKPFWTSLSSQVVLYEFRKLRFGPTAKQALSEVDRQTKDWQEQFDRFLVLLDKWQAADEDIKENYLHQKAVILSELFEISATDKQREEVLDRYLSLLKYVDSNNISHIEWFWHANHFLRQIHNQKTQAKYIDLLSSSGIPTLQLYVSLMDAGLYGAAQHGPAQP